MDALEFLTETVRPVLQDMGLYSPTAEKLLLMTACHESMGFRYKVQMGGGPARSYYQIEPETALKDLYDTYFPHRPDRAALLERFTPDDTPPAEALMNDRYATAAARLIYARRPEALPEFNDDEGLAHYWKEFWNTALGAGTIEKFLADWARYKPADY